MRISKIEVRNFRGLRGFRCDTFADVVIFCGRNNCGKTTILEAVDFLYFADIGSTLANINSSRHIALAGWNELRTAFSDMDESRSIVIAAEFAGGAARKVSATIHRANIVQFTGDKVKDDLMSRFLEVDIADRKNGTDVAARQARFYWTAGGENVGDFVRPGWVTQNSEAGNTIPCVYLPSTVHSDVCLTPLRRLCDAKRHGAVVSALAKIDSRIIDIRLDGEIVKVDVSGVESLLPIRLLGDGMLKILNVLMAIEVCDKGGVVLVDEIDNGLHYSAYMNLLKVVLAAAKEKAIQLVFTTHNHEFLSRIATREALVEDLSQHGRFVYNNIIRAGDGSIFCEAYDFASFRSAIESGMEVR